MANPPMDEQVRGFLHAMWASVAGAWGVAADEVDERATAITSAMLDGAALTTTDRVLELACGPGGAGLAAAAEVRDGEVVLSDVVAEMVEIAAARAAARGLTNVRTAVRDLEAIDEPDASFDVVLCREGLMFALDPSRAASEMHRVLRPGGRLAIAVWAAAEDNPWLSVVFDVLRDVAGITVPPPGVPGPFALGDETLLRTLFSDAGYTDIAVRGVPAALRSPNFDMWWQRNLTVAGPVVSILNGLDRDTVERVRDAVHEAIARYESADGLELPGLSYVVLARRP